MKKTTDLAVFVYLGHTKISDIRAKASLQVGESLEVPIHTVDSPLEIERQLLGCQSEWILLISEMERVNSSVLGQVKLVREQSPETRLFFLQEDWDKELHDGQPSEFVEQLFGLTPFGILFNADYVKNLGGFSKTHTHSFDVELFLRCAKSDKPLLAGISKPAFSSIERQVRAFTIGAERVSQVTDLVAKEINVSPAYWFRAYASMARHLKVTSEKVELALKMHQISVVAQGYTIAHQIRQADQPHLGVFLRRSVFDDGAVREEATDVDHALMEFFSRPAEPLVLHDSFRCFALGNSHECSQMLRQIGLKRVTGPFDWLAVNESAVEHMIQDQFKTFLDSKYHKPMSSQGMGEILKARDHTFYHQNFDVKGMFRFHDLRNESDRQLYMRAIAAFQNGLIHKRGSYFVYVTSDEVGLEVWDRIALALKQLSVRHRILVVRLCKNRIGPVRSEVPAQTVRIRRRKNLVFAELLVSGASEGLVFENTSDNIRLMRLIHGVALGLFGKNIEVLQNLNEISENSGLTAHEN